jgi:hypothetical protein
LKYLPEQNYCQKCFQKLETSLFIGTQKSPSEKFMDIATKSNIH